MTVTIGRNSIHLGWPAAASIILFTIGSTWALANFTYTMKSGQDKMIAGYEKLNATVNTIVKRDSAQDEHLKKVDENDVAVNRAIKGIRDTINRKPKLGFYFMHRDPNGHITYIPTTN